MYDQTKAHGFICDVEQPEYYHQLVVVFSWKAVLI